MSTDTPHFDRFTADAFFFTTALLESIGTRIDYAKVFERLEEVARGEVTLLDSLDEAISRRERGLGRPICDVEREIMTQQLLENRQFADEDNRQVALRIARVIQAHKDHLINDLGVDLTGDYPVDEDDEA